MQKTEQNNRDDGSDCNRHSYNGQKFHRLQSVRIRESVPLRTAARRLGIKIAEVKVQEEPTSDILLSTLQQWQQILQVPITELLIDTEDPLSPAISFRAQLVKVMKTAMSIYDTTRESAVKNLAETLVGQLVQLMPELEGVHPWHTKGKQKSHEDLGKTALQILTDPKE